MRPLPGVPFVLFLPNHLLLGQLPDVLRAGFSLWMQIRETGAQKFPQQGKLLFYIRNEPKLSAGFKARCESVQREATQEIAAHAGLHLVEAADGALHPGKVET